MAINRKYNCDHDKTSSIAKALEYTVLISANNILKSTYVSSLLVAFKGQLKDIKTCGTFFISSWSSELFDGLYFDDVKSADFGSEKKILV